MHGVIVESNSAEHSRQSYKVRVMKTGRVVTHNKRYIKETNNKITIPKATDC